MSAWEGQEQRIGLLVGSCVVAEASADAKDAKHKTQQQRNHVTGGHLGLNLFGSKERRE